MWSLELAPLSWDSLRGVWDHAKGVITEEVALELGFEGWGLFQPQRWRKDTEGTVSAKLRSRRLRALESFVTFWRDQSSAFFSSSESGLVRVKGSDQRRGWLAR